MTTHLTAASLVLAVLLSAQAPAFANSALAGKYSCLSCHAAAVKLVGPSYQDVAAKYSGDKGAVDTLIKNIRNGGSGKWGDMPMPPQAQVPEADLKRLATWILGGAR